MKKAYSSHITYRSNQRASPDNTIQDSTGHVHQLRIYDNTSILAKQQKKGLTPKSLVNKPHSSKQQLDGNGTRFLAGKSQILFFKKI